VFIIGSVRGGWGHISDGEISRNRNVSCKDPNRLIETHSIDVTDKLNDITAATTAATIPDLTLEMNRESVSAAAHRAGAAQFRSASAKLNAAALQLILKMNGPGILNIGGARDFFGIDHRTKVVTSPNPATMLFGGVLCVLLHGSHRLP
jgi:hypothetical protein